jgi:hypothetical protein
MSDKKQSASWQKHVLLGIVVLLVTILFLVYKPNNIDFVIGSDGQINENKNNISDNLTRFYEEFRLSSSDPIREEFGDFVVALKAPEKSQTQQLVAITSVDNPPNQDWEGNYMLRSFAQGTTIKTEAMKYAEQEGARLIWDLNQDFIIRQRFLSENSLVGTLDEIAGAIDANFVPEVNVYFCNKKMTIVIAEKAGTYVQENCLKAGFNQL